MRNAVQVLRKLACCGVVALAAGGMVRQATATPGGVSGASGNQLFKSSLYADLTGDPYLYFPTADEKDARFVAIVGNGLASLGDQVLSTKLAVPRGASELEVGVFDGDTGGIWDVGTTPVTFTLYADPLNASATSVMIRQWSSTQMADNTWTTLRVPLSDFQNVAQGPSGHYFFNLVIASTNPADTSLNAFKLRARGTVALRPTAFSVTAQVRLLQEAQIVYPAYPSVTPTTYDGQWNFFMDVPSTPDHFEVWDGDMDYGAANGSTVDTADPDTASSPELVIKTSPTGVAKLIPNWSNPAYVNAEGAKGKGNPADDAATPLIARSPSVQYDVIDANGTLYTNTNPSGTEEWERFRIDTAPFDRTRMDYHADQLPAGVYQMRVRGLDLSNLSAIKLEYDALGVSRNGLPGKPLRAFELGDTVWFDVNGDGVWQNNDNGIAEMGEEPGVPNVVVNLVDGSGNVVETARTDASGHYRFEVDNGNYLIEVSSANFQEGGVLHGLLSTTGGDVRSGAIYNTSDFNFDFGYHPRSGLSSCVWLDSNQNGIVNEGEPGISGVTVRAYRVDPVQGLVLVSTAVTNATGTFGFADLPAGPYELQVDPATLPAGLVATSDADGLSTPHTARAAVLDGEVSEVECFGYAGTGSIGDRVWCDDNQNGQQDAADPGIGAVRITLKSAQLTVSATTDATGYYAFTGLPSGTYLLEVDTRSLPLNRVFVSDRDGVLTPGSTLVTLAGTVMNVEDADFGYRGTGTIGDTVWWDVNRNGVQEAGEAGISGATVYLFGDLDGDGVPDYYQSTTTDDQGLYRFNNLFIGDYLVSVDAETLGLEATYDLDGTTTPDTVFVVLGAFSTVNQNVDFGYVQGPSAVGDRVWKDLNFNGVQDEDEPGLAGVTLTLCNAAGEVVATTTTSAEGTYLFTGLAAGDYAVAVSEVPAGLEPSFDLDGVGTAGKAVFTLGPGTAKRDVDFGYGYAGVVGDRVWLDTNLNGSQESGETGLAGVTVSLRNGSGTVLATATTDESGTYRFNHLPPGDYSVTVSGLPQGLVQTYDLDGVVTAGKVSFALAASQAKLDVDFGYGRVASIGDRVWLDANRNGVQDSGEAGIAGITVTLQDGSGPLETTSTDAAGLYQFEALPPGNYTVVLSDLPANVVQTFDLDGVGSADQASFTLVAGVDQYDVDFGYAEAQGSVGDRVWLDTNRNGLLDSGEAGLDGVALQLLNSAGAIVATTATDSEGYYLFEQVDPGNYTVQVSGLPAGAVPTFDLDGVATAHQASFTLAAGEDKLNLDFGYAPPYCSVGDRVWNDANRNGIQDNGEAGIAGVTVKLLDSNGATVATRTTDANGIFLFDQIIAGSYSVVVTAPRGLTQTYDLDGLSTPDKASFTLTAGEAKQDVDFGYGNPPAPTLASVGDRVWRDSNLNGVQDAGEPGISGVTVTLRRGFTTVATTTTNSNGEYLFSNLSSGSYSVTVTAPSGLLQTYDLDGLSTAHRATFNLGSGEPKRDVDFGYGSLGSLGDKVWLDSDLDGVRDSNEGGLACVAVRLYSSSGSLVATTTTSSNGSYLFSNVPAGTYTVIVSGVSSSLSPTYDLDGVNSAHKATVTLSAGQARADVDFGYGPVGSIGDRVWQDKDGDGCQDNGESGISGVTVTLRSSSGTVLATTTTDANGCYLFSNLVPANYSVTVSNLPSGYTPTYDLDGVSTAHKVSGPLGSGENRRDVDFGYKPAAPPVGSLGDKVWLDSDLDGVQDSNEGGLACVAVKLYSSTGSFVASTTTSSNGSYLFSNVPAGTYTVVVSNVSCGLSPTYDLDGVSTAHKAVVVLTAGQNRRDVDFGFGPVCSVGDRVWLDVDGDRCQDSGEAGIAGVTVRLYRGSSVVATTTTEGSGKYLFENLAPGAYSVEISNLPNGYSPTYDLDGTNSASKASFTVSAGDDRRDVDFGYKAGSSSGAGSFTTYTQGGWGASPNGNNPGVILKNNFSRVFSCGVKIGGKYSLNFTSSTAVANFLPQGGMPNKLSGNATNPTSSSGGVLAGQVLAMQINLEFSNARVTRAGLGSLKLQSGKFEGYTVASFCSLANRVLGGETTCLPRGTTISDVNDAATKVNENFDNGTTDQGFLR